MNTTPLFWKQKPAMLPLTFLKHVLDWKCPSLFSQDETVIMCTDDGDPLRMNDNANNDDESNVKRKNK